MKVSHTLTYLLRASLDIALRPQTHRSILGAAAGHIILTPANQLMVMGLKIWSLSNPGSNQRPFDHWPTSLPSALTGLTYLKNGLLKKTAHLLTHALIKHLKLNIFSLNTLMPSLDAQNTHSTRAQQSAQKVFRYFIYLFFIYFIL
jgi:hypothetical protein